MLTATIGIDKLDDEFKIQVKEDMTLEEFKNCLEKALGYKCDLNISKYDQKKKQKVKDLFKGDFTIFSIKNENIGTVIKHFKGNFINKNNGCFRDSLTQSIVHSMADKIVEQEETSRKNKGYPPAKNFKDFKGNSPDNSAWSELVTVCDDILNKMKNNDTSPLYNSFDASSKPPSQTYEVGGNYTSRKLTDLSNDSTSTGSSGLNGGSLTIKLGQIKFSSNLNFTDEHEIFLNKRTVISDCINIDVRSFSKCSKCYFSNISVLKIGNIMIIISDFLKSNYEKSFNGLLKYYYKNNDFGYGNIRRGEKCDKCKTNNLETYNMISTLPEILIVELNLHNYYNNSTDSFLKEDSFYWALQEEISLKDYYDNYSDKYYNYELTSFIGHFGDKSLGHFINFSKIDDQWYLFDDLSKEEAVKLGNLEIVKILLKGHNFGFLYGPNKVKVESKLKICTLFYEKNRCKGYEYLIKNMKNIFYKK